MPGQVGDLPHDTGWHAEASLAAYRAYGNQPQGNYRFTVMKALS